LQQEYSAIIRNIKIREDKCKINEQLEEIDNITSEKLIPLDEEIEQKKTEFLNLSKC
jgi:hypothetical protein